MKSQIFHHAFRTIYSGVVRELITDATIALPSSTHPGPSKEFKNFLALLDTGATNSVINAVGLISTGKATVKKEGKYAFKIYQHSDASSAL